MHCLLAMGIVVLGGSLPLVSDFSYINDPTCFPFGLVAPYPIQKSQPQFFPSPGVGHMLVLLATF